MVFKFKIGQIITQGGTTIAILDEAHFCYKVLSERGTAKGVRLISKSILEEFVDYVKLNPGCTAKDARDALVGKSINDKYEYGYDSTYLILARKELGLI